jgi:hypothetical protein
MPFLYKPKFCCQCGEAIDRVEWNLWTSRRFCSVCESIQKQHDLMPRAVMAIGLIAALFGISGFMARSKAEPTAAAQVVAARPAMPSAHKAQEMMPSALTTTPRNDRSSEGSPAGNFETAAKPNPPQTKSEAAGPEAIYFCGAATRKGTPCSRRVKTPGRCWQHMGQPSMIADTKQSPVK